MANTTETSTLAPACPVSGQTRTDAQDTSTASLSRGAEWRRVLLLAFLGLPIVTLLCVCAYGFVIWFMQILFWGPPS